MGGEVNLVLSTSTNIDKLEEKGNELDGIGLGEALQIFSPMDYCLLKI